MRRHTKILPAAALLFAVCAAGPADARVTFEEHFEGGGAGLPGSVESTRHGAGWRSGLGTEDRLVERYLRYPAAEVLAPEAGTIEVDLVRRAGVEVETLFTLARADGSSILSADVYWGGLTQSGRPEIDFSATMLGTVWYVDAVFENAAGSHEVKQATIPFNRGIAVGENVHVVITWGRTASECTVYVNGERLSHRVDDPAAMGAKIRAADSVVFGAIPGLGWKGADFALQSVLEYVRVQDTARNGQQLYSRADRYLPDGEGAEIASFRTDAFRVAGFSGKLVAGNTLTATLQGTPGGTATFDIVHYPDLLDEIALDWRGWGVYLEEKTFYDRGEVNLRDVEGYDVYVATEPFDPTGPGLEPVESLEVREQGYTVTDVEADTPYYVAVVARMRDGTRRVVIAPLANLAMTETAPGTYSGTYTVGWKTRYPRAAAVGRLRRGGAVATQVAERRVEIDTALNVAVATSPAVLPADERSTSRVTVTVTDANGDAVSGHKVNFLLATTSQYTGVVGGGAFAEQVGGAMRESAWGETDIFGKLTATYVAGFAAKTAVIVARDMVSNSTGAGHVTTFIRNTAQIELTPVEPAALAAEGYAITLVSSDSWLTADGVSRARLTARVTLRGQPVQGHTVRFDLAGIGSLRVVQGVTDRNGEARAVYTAGRRIGIVVVRATDVDIDMSAAVSIELRSDAPAKIAIRVEPGTLPADGRSRADVLVTVTDINDNPNDNVEVEYAVTQGGGEVRDERTMTDRRGESGTTYVAGRTPGTVTLEITVRSTVPSAEELASARGLAVEVPDSRFF